MHDQTLCVACAHYPVCCAGRFTTKELDLVKAAYKPYIDYITGDKHMSVSPSAAITPTNRGSGPVSYTRNMPYMLAAQTTGCCHEDALLDKFRLCCS